MIQSDIDPEWILAIDDDPWSLEISTVALEAEGWHVQRASSGDEATTILSRLGAPALVLVDAMMPKEDGFTLCRRLRKSPALRSVPIVFATALDDEEMRAQALEAGADDFLTKPVTPSLLVTRVRTLVELNRLRTEGETRTRYGVIMETLGEGVVTLDDNDNVIEANRAAIGLLGLPRDPLARIHLPSHIARFWTVVRGETGRNHDARLVFRRRDRAGTTAIDWTSRSLPGAGEEAWTLVVRDATDMWERDQALGRMMKSLGHKLRTPLTGLSVSLEFARDCQSDPLGAEMVETARQSATRLEDTILRMLEFVDAAGVDAAETAPVPTSPDELVTHLCRHQGATVSTTLTRPVRIELELALQAVDELVANAQAAGATEIAIVVAPHPARSVQFEITDNGSGIPAAAENRVFEPFYQLDRTGEQPGAGLGLSIMRASVARAGGSTGAWFTPERGTTVWFRLPDRASELQAVDGACAGESEGLVSADA
jgi:signal transduction histidine kinase